MSVPVGPGIYAHPVRVVDNVNNARGMLVHANGSIDANIIGTVPVSGTITALQGTIPWVTSVSNFPTVQQIEGVTAVGDLATENPILIGAVDGNSGIKSNLMTLSYSGFNAVPILDFTRPQGGTPVGFIISANGQLATAPTDQINCQSLYFDVSGTFVGDLIPEYVGPVMMALLVVREVGTGTIVSSIQSAGMFVAECADPLNVRLIAANWISGSAGVAVSASTTQSGEYAYQAGEWTTARNWVLNGGTDSISVSNFPATQPVSGTVAVSNFPAIQPVSQSGTWNINNVSGTVSLPTGAGTSALQTTGNTSLSTIATQTTAINGKMSALGQSTMANSMPVVIASNQTTLAISAASLPLPTGASTEATLSTLNGKVPSNLTVTATRLLVDGSGVTQPISGSITVTPSQPATATLSNVAGSVTSVTLSASNAARRNATIYNDSTANNLFVKFGSAASATSFTVLVPSQGYYELPSPPYTGIITGIWIAATGAARVTELT